MVKEIVGKKRFLGQILREENLVSEEQLEVALKEQQRTGKFLGRTLVDLHFLDEKKLRRILSIQSGIEKINLKELNVDQKLIGEFPAALAKTYQTFPVRIENNNLTLAVTDALDINVRDDIKFIIGKNVKVVLANATDIQEAIDKYYGKETATIQDLIKTFEKMPRLELSQLGQGEVVDVTTLEEVASQAPVIQLYNLILVQVAKDNASDLHLEPFENDFRVRYRVDGKLYDLVHPTPELAFGLFCRFKIMAGMDIAERRLPQDGRVELFVGNRGIDLRVSTVPTVFGECLAVRILDREKMDFTLDNIGVDEEEKEKIKKLIRNPQGIILATGPTGCGKTTTLYASLKEINSPEIKLITTEDPVEYLLHGAIQVPIREKIGLTFASTLRNILRQDPDVILVGEVRDFDTAQIAIQASLTGHLVFSTLHTNDAPSTITRLIDMKIEPFLLASTIIAVVGQRLVRRLCPHCKEIYQPTETELAEVGLTKKDIEGKKIYRSNPKGCSLCKGGYHGRTAIFELLVPNEGFWQLVLQKRPVGEIREKAKEIGMKTMLHSGLEKIFDGRTTIEEVTSQIYGYA